MGTITTIAGVDLDIEERGKGPPLLVLHGGEGLGPERPWLDLLARTHRVIAPHHPGFGRSACPEFLGTVDDLAYLYLDLADTLGLNDATLLGASFGGWIAAEMAVRSTARFSRLVLCAPLGIKVGGRTDRDIADMHDMTREAFVAAAFVDRKLGAFDPKQHTDMELAQIVRGREALTLFGWKPYMHNPRLKHWLHRIAKPTLFVWGDKDRIVTPDYGRAFAAEVPGARIEIIKDCGHFPLWEKPDEVVKAVGSRQ